jgi:hypothetical protein
MRGVDIAILCRLRDKLQWNDISSWIFTKWVIKSSLTVLDHFVLETMPIL